MSCPVRLSAHKIPCPTMGGIQAVYFIDKAEIAGLEEPLTYAINAGVLTITHPDSADLRAFKIEAIQNTFNFTQPITSNQESNTVYFLQTLEGRLDGITAENSVLATEINKGTFEVIIEMRNGKLIYAGYDPDAGLNRGLRSGGGDGGATGAAAEDPTGFTLNLTMQCSIAAPMLEGIPEDVFNIISTTP